MITWAEKRVCVTGGAGFLGSALVETLRDCGAKEIFVPRSRNYDLTTTEGVKRLFRDARPQVLFHLAAIHSEKPGTSFYGNTIMGLQLVEMARQFELDKTVIVGADTPATQALHEQCRAYRMQYGMDAIVLLPAELYGPGDHSRHVPALIRRLLDAKEHEAHEITCPGQADSPASLLYVEDAARGLIQAAEKYTTPLPCLLHNGAAVPRGDLAAQIARLCEFKGNLRWAGGDSFYPGGFVSPAASDAATEFGFEARVGLLEGLQRTVAWCREHRQ